MKNWMMGLLTLFVSTNLMAGDILFIDINNVTPEIAVVSNYLRQAQAQGLEKGTRLVVVPSYETFTVEQRRKLEQLSIQIERIFKIGGNYDEAARLGKEIRKIKTGREDQEYTIEQLASELHSVLQNSQYRFDRVFISGHHSPTLDGLNGVLGGEFLNGFSAEIAQSLLNNATTTQNVHSLILLGCYTGIPTMLSQNTSPWAAVLPRAVLHFGYNNPAPLKTDPVNLNILQRLISAQNLIAGELASKQTMTNESMGKLSHYMTSIPTQGRYLGFKIGTQYIQHPHRGNK